MLCVSDTLVCDGIRHCPNGNEFDSDEDPELCLKHKNNVDSVSGSNRSKENGNVIDNFPEKWWQRIPAHRQRNSENFPRRRKCFGIYAPTKDDNCYINKPNRIGHET